MCVHVQARANRGILYVDEVNLLDDGLVDVVLDSAASGINTVEREGVSIVHPAKFIMIGSGNPAVSVGHTHTYTHRHRIGSVNPIVSESEYSARVGRAHVLAFARVGYGPCTDSRGSSHSSLQLHMCMR